MTHTPTLDRYRRGDLASLPQSEPDPIEDWCAHAEDNADGLRSIRMGDSIVACIGFFTGLDTQADAFAVIDRDLCKGAGPEVAKLVRHQQIQWMKSSSITEVLADCRANDRPAQVFLRAIGYRKVRATDSTVYFAFTGSK